MIQLVSSSTYTNKCAQFMKNHQLFLDMDYPTCSSDKSPSSGRHQYKGPSNPNIQRQKQIKVVLSTKCGQCRQRDADTLLNKIQCTCMWPHVYKYPALKFLVQNDQVRVRRRCVSPRRTFCVNQHVLINYQIRYHAHKYLPIILSVVKTVQE
jgi:hypothetical protein